MRILNTPFIIIILLSLLGCNERKTILASEQQPSVNVLDEEAKIDSFGVREKVYVPIYSDIYSQSKDFRFQLTATLSIRNTSIADTLYITNVTYYNTIGEVVRNYVDKSIFLKPLETIEYVIEQEDTEGGTGANFIIDWSAKHKIKPIFQGVMVGFVGQQGFAFTTEGITIPGNSEK